MNNSKGFNFVFSNTIRELFLDTVYVVDKFIHDDRSIYSFASNYYSRKGLKPLHRENVGPRFVK